MLRGVSRANAPIPHLAMLNLGASLAGRESRALMALTAQSSLTVPRTLARIVSRQPHAIARGRRIETMMHSFVSPAGLSSAIVSPAGLSSAIVSRTSVPPAGWPARQRVSLSAHQLAPFLRPDSSYTNTTPGLVFGGKFTNTTWRQLGGYRRSLAFCRKG